MFVSVFAGVGMKIDNWQNATLGNWVMVGYTVGLIFAVIARAKNVHLKWMYCLASSLSELRPLYVFRGAERRYV